VLAVIGAVLIIAVAAVMRSALDDDQPRAVVPGDEDLVVVCSLSVACEDLVGPGISAAPAQQTAAAIEDGSLPDDVDAWVTTRAWVEIIEARAPGVLGAVEVLGTSPVVLAAVPERAAELDSLCADRPLLRCLGESTGRPWAELGGEASWGRLTTGLPDADGATGLDVLAAAAAGYFGGVDFASNDFTADAGFQGWLDDLYREDTDRGPVRTMVTSQGSYSAAGEVEANALAQAGQRPIELLEPDPAVSSTAVLVQLRGHDDRPDVASMRGSLAAAGWAAADGEAPSPTLKPGVMAALHALWTETTR